MSLYLQVDRPGRDLEFDSSFSFLPEKVDYLVENLTLQKEQMIEDYFLLLIIHRIHFHNASI